MTFVARSKPASWIQELAASHQSTRQSKLVWSSQSQDCSPQEGTSTYSKKHLLQRSKVVSTVLLSSASMVLASRPPWRRQLTTLRQKATSKWCSLAAIISDQVRLNNWRHTQPVWVYPFTRKVTKMIRRWSLRRLSRMPRISTTMWYWLTRLAVCKATKDLWDSSLS